MIKRDTPDLPDRQTIRVPFFPGDDDVEFRIEQTSDGGLQSVRVAGVASVYDYEYEVYGGPAVGGWYERIARGAFDETLAKSPDVVLLLNHEGMPLARTKSGTLTLTNEKKGLGVKAELDMTNPLVQTLASSLSRGDVDEMSFAFRVTEQTWEAHKKYKDDEMSLRTITAVNLHRGDVSAVTYGASDKTTINLTRSLELATDAELRELQALIAERLDRSDNAAHDGMSERERDGGMPPNLLHLLRL